MEIVDIVDENDTVLYQLGKEEAHAKGLLHRTIIAEVIDQRGRWMLVKQAHNRQDAGQYVSPVGGHVRSGELVEEALKREALEELGLTVFTSKFIGKEVFNRSILGRNENHLFILYEIYTDQEATLNHESVTFTRFTKDEIRRLLKESPTIFGDAFHFVVKSFYKLIFY